MDDLSADTGAIFEATVFLSHFSDLPDPCQAVKVIYPLVSTAETNCARWRRKSG